MYICGGLLVGCGDTHKLVYIYTELTEEIQYPSKINGAHAVYLFIRHFAFSNLFAEREMF